MRRLLGSCLAVAALLAGTAAVASWQSRSRPPAAFTAAAGPSIASSRPTVRSTPPAPATRSMPAVPIGFVPASIRLGSPMVNASIVPILSLGGQLQPPTDPRQVGWWQGSALAGASTGSTVLVGHVDSAQLGLGAFYQLDKVTSGAVVQLSDGRKLTRYRVDSLQYLAKTQRLPASLFDRAGSPRLVLITCGGSFDSDAESYRDNVVVTATAVSPD